MSAAEREVPSSGETGAQDPAPSSVGDQIRALPLDGRSVTTNRKQLRRELRGAEPLDPEERAELEAARPRTRGDCEGGERPCPFISCKYHLAYDVTPVGSLKENFPGFELDELPETCALDVADRGGIILEEVATFTNLTRERIRQVEEKALVHLRAAVETYKPEPRSHAHLMPAPVPKPPKEIAMPIEPHGPTTSFQKAMDQRVVIQRLEADLKTAREMLAKLLVAAEEEIRELRSAAGATHIPSGGGRGGKRDAEILELARKGTLTPASLAERFGGVSAATMSQALRRMTRAGALRVVARGVYEAAA